MLREACVSALKGEGRWVVAFACVRACVRSFVRSFVRSPVPVPSPSPASHLSAFHYAPFSPLNSSTDPTPAPRSLDSPPPLVTASHFKAALTRVGPSVSTEEACKYLALRLQHERRGRRGRQA